MHHLHSLPDMELVRLFASSHERAFHHLYKRHQQNIYRVAVYYLKDKTLAEDVTQDAFIKIIHFIQEGRYCEDGKFLPWALRIARNVCMDHLRKPKGTTYVAGFWEQSQLSFPTSSQEAKLVEQQTASQLYRLIDKLPDTQKRVLCYRHFEELSFK